MEDMKHILLIALFLTLALSQAFAHAASSVSASYDAKTSLLTVNFSHKVSNAADHFINSITVQTNGKEAVKQTLTRQESAEGGSLSYKLIGLAKGDKITVTSVCNKTGNKSATITIP
jgi:hypothetical protein